MGKSVKYQNTKKGTLLNTAGFIEGSVGFGLDLSILLSTGDFKGTLAAGLGIGVGTEPLPLPDKACPGNQYLAEDEMTCKPCLAGYYCPDDSIQAQICPVDFYCPGDGTKVQCIAERNFCKVEGLTELPTSCEREDPADPTNKVLVSCVVTSVCEKGSVAREGFRLSDENGSVAREDNLITDAYDKVSSACKNLYELDNSDPLDGIIRKLQTRLTNIGLSANTETGLNIRLVPNPDTSTTQGLISSFQGLQRQATNATLGLGFTVYLPGRSGDTNGWGGWDVGVDLSPLNLKFNDNVGIKGITFHLGLPWYSCEDTVTGNKRLRTSEEFLENGNGEWYLGGFTIDFADVEVLTAAKAVSNTASEAYTAASEALSDGFDALKRIRNSARFGSGPNEDPNPNQSRALEATPSLDQLAEAGKKLFNQLKAWKNSTVEGIKDPTLGISFSPVLTLGLFSTENDW